MKVAIAGSSGLIGSALVSSLTANGHQVAKLVRQQPELRQQPKQTNGELYWSPKAGELDASALVGCDALVNLCGESVAQRWTEEARKKIIESRLKSTKLLAETIASMDKPPAVFIQASAIGFYGDRGEEIVDETSKPGSGFLAELCQSWEAATSVCKDKTRVVNLRIGLVLDKHGGALEKMLPPFLLGAGGILGSGKQYMSFIALPDLVELIQFLISNSEISGPVNAVAPNAVTNKEFTDTLGHELHRPTIFPVPSFGAKLLFGQMAEEMLLSGARVKPKKLLNAGFKFQYPQIDSAVSAALK